MDKTWERIIKKEQSKDYYQVLNKTLNNERKHYNIYPPKKDIFKAFELCPYHKIKVVILGQDPYIKPSQANGLAFSVNEKEKLPPSLKNIFKALQNDLKAPLLNNGDLSFWAKQGVLLLNCILSVRENIPNSHQSIGWQQFTDSIIKEVNKSNEPIVFLLWGASAQQKKTMVGKQHLILCAPHPSPLSAYKGFIDCKHFSIANAFLISQNRNSIDWSCDNHES